MLRESCASIRAGSYARNNYLLRIAGFPSVRLHRPHPPSIRQFLFVISERSEEPPHFAFAVAFVREDLEKHQRAFHKVTDNSAI
jgi:hypothetical protein